MPLLTLRDSRMITEGLQKLELGVSHTLNEREDRLRQSFQTSENNIRLNLEVASLRVVHALASVAVTAVEILTPRSTE